MKLSQSAPSTTSSSASSPATAIMKLPAKAEEAMSRKQKQRIFEQVKLQVGDLSSKYFDQCLIVLKNWMREEEN